MSRVEDLLGRVSIVLARPKYAENLGAVARVAYNMGVGQLVVVGSPPRDLEPALKTATHNAAHLVREILYHDSLATALVDYVLVVGTTARLGRQRMPMAEPSQVGERILPALVRGRAALLFGPEDKGLSNQELTFCGLVVNIPTAPQFSSLNLAQAVAILCYELYQGLLRLDGQTPQGLYHPRPARPQELSGMFEEARLALQALDEFFGQGQADTRLRHLRQAVSQGTLSARETKVLKDTCRQVLKAVEGR